MLIIYTGDGKGKTTAAFGMALRAAGWGRRVAIFQFVKEESWEEGARNAIRSNLKDKIEIEALGIGFVGIMGDRKPFTVHKKAAKDGVRLVLKLLKSPKILKYDLIICDEILGALHGGLLEREDIERIFQTMVADTEKHVDLVFTGRNAPKWLVDRADLVTEMRKIKHPFDRGLQAKKGIDY